MAAFNSFVKTKPEFGAQKNALETLRSNFKDVGQAPLAEDYEANYFDRIANSGGDESKMSSVGKILKSGLQGYSAGKANSAGQKRALKMEQIQAAIDYQSKVAEKAAQQEQDYNVYQQNLMTVQPALASVVGAWPTLDEDGRKQQAGAILNMMGNGLNQDVTVQMADSKGNITATNNATGDVVFGNIYSLAKLDEANPLMAEAWKMQTETGRIEMATKRAHLEKAQADAANSAAKQPSAGQPQGAQALAERLGPEVAKTPLIPIASLSNAAKTKVVNNVISSTNAAESTQHAEQILDKLVQSKGELQKVLERDVLQGKRTEPTLTALEIGAVNRYINEGASGHWDASLLNNLRPEIQDAVQKAAVQQNILSQAQALALQRGASSDKRELLERMSIPRIDQRAAAFDASVEAAKEGYNELRKWAEFSEFMEFHGFKPTTQAYTLFKNAAQQEQAGAPGGFDAAGASDIPSADLSNLTTEELERILQQGQ